MASPAVSTPAISSAPGSSLDIVPGAVLAERYRIDESIAKGSESGIFLAEQVSLHRKVAVKVLHAAHPNLSELAARFEREALVAAGIENPNIAGALECGKLADGSAFFVFEYVPGRSLRAELAKGPLSLARGLHIAKQVASALADTHELGIVHYDLKPERLMLLRRGDDLDFVKVLDVGLPGVTPATRPGSKAEFVLGTPGYMPPEQALGQPVDGRADLYALGAVLFEMLAGVRLFEGSGILAKQLAGHIPTFAERAPGVQVSPELEKLVKRLLAPSAAERFANADDLIEALDTLASGARASAPPPAPAPAHTPSEKPVAKSSVPPPMSLRRTQSGPPAAADRLPHGELPPPAKLPVRLNATPATGVPVDESDIPTTVSLPKVPVLPPFAPLPAVSAATAPPPARSAQPAGTAKPAAAPSAALSTLGARVAELASRASGYSAPLRARLEDKRTLVLGAAVGASLGAALLAFVVLRSGSHEGAAGDPQSSANAASLAASSGVGATTLPRETSAEQRTSSLASKASGSDEASIFLTLASDYVRDHREAEAVALVSRVVLRQPELKDDARVAGVLSKTARSDTPQAADDSLALLTGPMGEKGAELMYSLALEPSLKDAVRRRVEAWLASKDFDRTSSAALYSAVKLRNAKTCDQKHALLTLAADVGGKQTLELLRDLDAHTICGASDLKNCYPCLASDSRIKDSIQRLEKRLTQ
jgi:serine/threonine-protein kinase